MRPNLIFNSTVWKFILTLWAFIWLFVFFKNLFFKGYLRDYTGLLKRNSLEEKRSFVTGDYLYELIQFCKINLPNGATFGYDGIEDASLSDRRIRYYLYPHLKSDKPDCIIVYNKKIPSLHNEKLPVYKRLDRKRYILKRK